MPDRFYVPGEWSDCLELEGAEAHHLSRVLRAVPGDRIEIFDGQGKWSLAEVETVRKRSVIVRVIPPIRITPAPQCEVVLAVAVPKGERWRWMIEKVTELGVDRLIPLSTKRSIVSPSDQKLHKAEQVVIAACKQSGRDRLLRIEETCPLEKLETRLALDSTRLFVGTPRSENASSISFEGLYSMQSVAAIVGPEGGLTTEEETLLAQWEAVPVTLSSQILRIETAAIAFSSWLCGGRTQVF